MGRGGEHLHRSAPAKTVVLAVSAPELRKHLGQNSAKGIPHEGMNEWTDE